MFKPDETTYKLNDGNQMPVLGFGTYKLDKPELMNQSVQTAYNAGYRLFDTAQYYRNEKMLGDAIRNLGVRREDVFITDKVTEMNQGHDLTINSTDFSLQQLGTDYIDLLLVHWPVAEHFFETWEAFEELKKQGKVRSIGVSNFTRSQLELLKTQANEMPVVNQIETHPYLTQAPLIKFDHDQSIVTQAWSPLGRGLLLDNPMINKMAAHHHKSAAQIILRWDIQRGVAVIPKSQDPKRIAQNADLNFELSGDEMSMLDVMNRNQRTGNEPELVYELGKQYKMYQQ
ncbi:aldo/keto reductase [Lentilactobacillus parafarraginis]|jgi:diketogulonate reductase-like aldo/keto reductase|uniref:Glyoxal reductase n=2 Tax=Lentilactobacillus parafarraginis TaxID=390842 RepID=A0A0R1YI24_9LACO|nr:aldo/keto reductase [Lentilactobacillus parafarraginis]KRM41901.1 glyoxal reductase [Lentilactobacillus parafarraginis DSM 18390 = JCM 14109]TLQ19760.1 aldo/keto reductase [Lentilactobacillus parafarraginis]